MSTTPHDIITAASLAPPIGYAHAVRAAAGRTVYLGGQTAQGADGAIKGASLVDQLDVAAGNLCAALAAAGGTPQHVVSMLILVTDIADYRSAMPSIGEVWRSHFGHHYPAITLCAVNELFDRAACVELTAVAVVP